MVEVAEGRVPKDRVALRELHRWATHVIILTIASSRSIGHCCRNSGTPSNCQMCLCVLREMMEWPFLDAEEELEPEGAVANYEGITETGAGKCGCV